MIRKPFIIPKTLHPKFYIPEKKSIYIIKVCQRAAGRSESTTPAVGTLCRKVFFVGGGIRTKLGICSYYVAFE
jgi:hypothetical protein